MSTQQDKNAEALSELADIFELAATKIRITLKGTGKKEDEPRVECTADPDKLAWADKIGNNGPFQLTRQVDHMASADYSALDIWLKTKAKGAFYKGMFYWRFKNGDAIGRKKTQGRTQ